MTLEDRTCKIMVRYLHTIAQYRDMRSTLCNQTAGKGPVLPSLCFQFQKGAIQYSHQLCPNLFLPPGESGKAREKSFFWSIFSSAQARSVKAVCSVLNKLIPYLWGSGTLHLCCNVIRGQDGEQGTCRCSAQRTHTHFYQLTPLLFRLHLQLDSLQGDCNYREIGGKAYSSCLSKSRENKQISCKSL